jgi:hypothetical protein
MPTLKIIAACERVLFDQEGPVSVVNIFQRMNVQLQAAPLPDKAVFQSLWSVFTLWENDPKEVGQEFTQVIQVFAPDGSLFVENEWSFKNTDADSTQFKIRARFPTLPIWAEGDVIVRVRLKNIDAEQGSFRFAIRYLPRGEDAKPIEPTKA